MIDVRTAQPVRHPAQQVQFFQRARRVRQETQVRGAVARGTRLQAPGHLCQRGVPVGIHPAAIARAHARCGQALVAVQALVAEAVAIGDPGFVDGLARLRHDAQQLTAQHMPVELSAEAVVGRDQRMLGHLPGTCLEAVWLAVQRAHGAQVDDVAREFVIDAVLDEGADLHVLAAPGGAELLDAGNVLPEAHAARAVDAAGHVGGYQRPEAQILDHALAFVVTRHVATEAHRQVLQFALAALVADRAIKRMIDEQELHGRLLRRDRLGRARIDLHALGDRRGAGWQRLRRLLDLHQAHAAVGGDRQLVVVAEARNVGAVRVGDADDHLALGRLDRDAVDLDVDELDAHAAACPSAVTRLRPP